MPIRYHNQGEGTELGGFELSTETTKKSYLHGADILFRIILTNHEEFGNLLQCYGDNQSNPHIYIYNSSGDVVRTYGVGGYFTIPTYFNITLNATSTCLWEYTWDQNYCVTGGCIVYTGDQVPPDEYTIVASFPVDNDNYQTDYTSTVTFWITN